jgi:ubiquinone/menaquinone biosynthesis C-methylase UbiE
MKSFDEKSRESYNQKADGYDNSFEGMYTYKFKELLLEEMAVKQGYNVLDAGCGNGSLLKMLAKKYDIHGYGTDISEKMIENARLRNPDMVFEVAGCESIPFENEQFDIITVCAAYHHFPNVKSFAKEVLRLLKQNGALYIAEVYYNTIMRLLCNPFIPLSKAGDVKFYSPKEITKNFEALGFRQVSFKTSGHVQIIGLQKLQASS